jgi:hypothetical protein
MLLTIAGASLALGLVTGKLLAIENGFSSPKVKLGEQSIQIRPVSEVLPAGTKLGLPLFEMRDTFFVRISYECSGEDSEMAIIKDSKATLASEVYRVGQKCYQTFRSSSPMTGVLTVRLKRNGEWYEENVGIQRKEMLSCPLWDMLMSV